MSDALTTLVSFEQTVQPTDAVLRTLEDLYTDAVLAVWEEKGFADIRPLETAFPCRLYSARFGAAPLRCVLAMPAPAAGYLRMQAITEAQYTRIEREFAAADVYYAALVLTEQAFELFGPVLIRKAGAWLTDDIDTDQMLPASRREHSGGELGLLLGDLFWFKLLRVLFPRFAQEGHPCIPAVQGLEPEARCNKQYFYLGSEQAPPCWKGLVESVGEGEEKRMQFCCSAFFPSAEDVPLSELELLSRPTEDEADGLVELMGPTGHRLWAESAEAVVYGAGMPLGRRYRWNLWMVADSCSDNMQEIPISEGALYDELKASYIDTHGEAPPAGHVFRLSTAHMRALNQLDEDEYAASCMLCGVVEELREVPLPAAEFPEASCLMAVLHCIPDDEDTTMCVYLPAAALGDYVPKVGDNIACTGTLHASAQELLETAESWLDSAEIAERTEEQARSEEAHAYFDACKESSLALAEVAVAFVKGGRTVEQYDPDRFSRKQVPLCVRNQHGELASVFVDTVIDGHEPQYSFASQREAIEEACRDRGETAVFATVELRYKPEGNRYTVEMRLSPEQEGVVNTLVECAEGFLGSIPRLTEDGCEDEPRRPEHLDEAAAARLMAEACATGMWAEFAKWLREEMRFRDRRSGQERELYGKIDFLRFLTEDIEESKEKGYWHKISFAVGTVETDGVRRPAAARFSGKYLLTSLYVFSDSHGTIGEVVSLPRETYANFVAETLIPNRDLPEGVEAPRTGGLGMLCPEYRLLPLPDCAPESNVAAFAETVMAVKRFLDARGTPCVALQANPNCTPHLWFREADGRLAYICVNTPMSGLFHGLLKCSYHGYSATVAADGSVSLGELHCW